jgi:hypothetical protein
MEGVADLLVTRSFPTYCPSIFLLHIGNIWPRKVFCAVCCLQPSNMIMHNMFLLRKKGIVLDVEKGVVLTIFGYLFDLLPVRYHLKKIKNSFDDEIFFSLD